MAVPAPGAPGEPGTPKSFDRVIISRTLRDTVTKTLKDGTAKTYEYFSPFVAHELLHCCNVWHHGERDTSVYWKAETVAGETKIFEYANLADAGHPEKGRSVNVKNEDGVSYYPPDRPFWATPRSIYLGEQHGQHSGDEDCVMRYDISNAHREGHLP